MWKQWVIVFYPGLSLDDTNLCLTYDSQLSCSLSISVSLSLSLGQSLDHGPKSTWSPWQCLWESRWSYHAIPLRVHQNQQPTGWTAVRTLNVITGLMSEPHCSLWLFVLLCWFQQKLIIYCVSYHINGNIFGTERMVYLFVYSVLLIIDLSISAI